MCVYVCVWDDPLSQSSIIQLNNAKVRFGAGEQQSLLLVHSCAVHFFTMRHAMPCHAMPEMNEANHTLDQSPTLNAHSSSINFAIKESIHMLLPAEGANVYI